MAKKNLMKNPTQGTIQRVTSEDIITSFYGLDGAAAAIKASTFDLMEEMSTIIQHARDPDPKVSLAALKQFRSVMKEVVNSNGMIGTIQQTEILPDSNITRTMSSSTLLTNLRNQNDEIQDQKEIPQKHEILRPKDSIGGSKTKTKVKQKSKPINNADSDDDGDGTTSVRRSST